MAQVTNESLKVLFFSYWYPSSPRKNFAIFVKRHAKAIASVCAIEVLAVHIIKDSRLLKTNYEVKDEEGLKTHHFYIQSRIYKLFYVLLPLQYWWIKRLINKKIKPDFNFNLIHSNVLFPCGIVGYQLAKYFHCKHAISEHWSKLDKFFKVSFYRQQGTNALNLSNALTCVSQQLSNTLNQYHQNKNSFVIPNVIDSSNFYVDQRIQKNKTITFTAVAHWHAPKNPFYFLEALKQLHELKKLGDFKLILIGTGQLLEEIKQHAYPFEIEMPGNLNTNDLRTHLNKCHYFLHGSDYETFSVVIVEALLCGLPSIVSPVGIASEVINEKNGLIALNEVNDWKDKIETMLKNKYDAQEISNGIGNKYSSNQVGQEFKKVYSTLTSNS